MAEILLDTIIIIMEASFFIPTDFLSPILSGEFVARALA